MEKKNEPSGKGPSQGFDPLDASYRKGAGSELFEALEKLEHRIEVSTYVAPEQELSEHCGLLEAYSNHAAESKTYAQLIRRLLGLRKEGDDNDAE